MNLYSFLYLCAAKYVLRAENVVRVKSSVRMKTKLPIILLVLLAGSLYSQNCTTSIDLPEEVVLCEPGTANLVAQVNGSFTAAQWAPVTGIANPNAISTTVDLSNSATYTLSVESISEVELIFNGDFSAGDTGFTSDYIYGTGGGVGLLSNEGQYAVVDDAGDTHNQFAHCSDHTGGGNMMVVNASGDLSNLWCQQVTVSENTDYQFSAWVTSVTSQNPAQLQFSINGVLLGDPYNASPSTCQWQSFFAEWNSGNATDAEICVVNSNLTPAGNDFALDDISFRELCTTTASIDLTIADLQVDIDGPNGFCSGSATVNLDDFLGNSTVGGNWTIDGQSANELDPSTLAVGAHTLAYTVTSGDCSVSDDLAFTIFAAPEAGQGSIYSDCSDNTATVDLNQLLSGADAGGSWSFAPGSATAGSLDAQGMYTPTGSDSGTFLFEYTVAGNADCPDDAALVTVELSPAPIADLVATASLDCFAPVIEIGGGNTTTGSNILYTWYENGTPLLDNDVATLQVSGAGNYTLEVLDQSTGCMTSAATSVSSLIADISFDLQAIPADCNAPNTGSISLTNISGGTGPYLARLSDGDFQSSTEFTNLEPGAYSVIVQDAGGCESEQTASLPSPMVPEIELSLDREGVIPLGTAVTLRAITNPPVESLDSIFWTPAPDGCDGCSQVRFKPIESTIYTLTAIDANGCVSEAQINVVVSPIGNIFFPNAISPNGDGFNDNFMIQDGGAVAQINELVIFNRWGNQIFKATNVIPNTSDQSWDGSFRGERVSQGVYVYSAEVQWISGEISRISGEIVVLY